MEKMMSGTGMPAGDPSPDPQTAPAPARARGLEPELRPAPFFIQKPAEEKEEDRISCCGEKLGTAADPMERPGYALCHFVSGFIDTPAGPVPRVKTTLQPADKMGALRARLGIDRNNYRVAPGLYAVGNPDAAAAALVTANFKLTFDTLRTRLDGIDAWVLVVDTRGINVWCAAGDGLFSTEGVIRWARQSGLSQVVSHRNLILPQLSATGVSGLAVKKGCGFSVTWGPIRAEDIPAFLSGGMKATTEMRRVTFGFWERMTLIPVEITLLRRKILWPLVAIFALSGIGAHLFSIKIAWSRGLVAMVAGLVGILAGTVLTPALLPWIPGRAFALKGVIAGVAAWLAMIPFSGGGLRPLEMTALLLFTVAISSFLAMNFTGATPFTSPSGVEREMRRAIPFQAAAALLAAMVWVGMGFVV